MSDMLPKSGNELDQALILLHAVNELDGCTADQLNRFIIHYPVIDYVGMHATLQALCSSGNLCRIDHPLDHVYVMTEAGQETLSLYIQRARSSVVERITNDAPQWRERFALERTLVTHKEYVSNGETNLTLQIVENNRAAMKLFLIMPNQKLAHHCEKNFKKHATELYEAIIQILSREEEP